MTRLVGGKVAEPDGSLAQFSPVTLAGGRAAALRADGVLIRVGWPELGGPMFHPTRAIEVREGKLLVAHDLGPDGEVVEAVDLRFQWSVAGEVSALQPYIMYGQSLAMNMGHDQPLTAAPVAPGRALRYANAGAGAQMSVSDRPGQDKRDFGPCHFPQSDLDRLKDLHEERGESPVSAAVAGFLPALSATTGVVATNHARGGVAMRKLLPHRLAEGRGTGIQYAGILRAAVRTRQFCDAHGCEMLQPILSFIHGEAFQPDDWQLYGQRLLALQAALTEDLGRITGRQEPVLVVTDQSRVLWGPEARLKPGLIPAAVAQLRVALANPGQFVCVGPKYFLPRRSSVKGRGDPVHLTAAASRLLGDYHGRAIRQTLQGRPWVPLHVAGYLREGAVIRLQVSGGDGSPLDFDTDLVQPTLTSLHGFRWVQDGGTLRQVAEVTLQGREIALRLDGDPGQAGKDFRRAALTIGFFGDIPRIDDGPRSGGRTTIRDSCPDIGSGGAPMFNWLCHDWFWEARDGAGLG